MQKKKKRKCTVSSVYIHPDPNSHASGQSAAEAQQLCSPLQLYLGVGGKWEIILFAGVLF